MSGPVSILRHTSEKPGKAVVLDIQTNAFSSQGEADSCGYCLLPLY